MSQRSNHERDDEFPILTWSAQSPDLGPKEHLWDVVDMDHGFAAHNDAVMTIITKILEECFQHLVKSLPRSI